MGIEPVQPTVGKGADWVEIEGRLFKRELARLRKWKSWSHVPFRDRSVCCLMFKWPKAA